MLKYLVIEFNGILDRTDYVITVIFGFIVSIIAMVWMSIWINDFGVYGIIWWIHLAIYIYYTLLIMSATVRRTNDIGISQMWCIGTLIPWIGLLFVIVFSCLRGKGFYERK